MVVEFCSVSVPSQKSWRQRGGLLLARPSADRDYAEVALREKGREKRKNKAQGGSFFEQRRREALKRDGSLYRVSVPRCQG